MLKNFTIAFLLALVAMSGAVGTASAYSEDPPVSGPDSIQAP